MKKSVKITIISASAVILSLFLIWNAAWLIFMNRVYKPLSDAVGFDDMGRNSVVAEDNWRYSVFKPSYLSFSGNLTVHESRERNRTLRELLLSYYMAEGERRI